MKNQEEMKAIVYERYGGPEVLQFRQIPKPVPKDDEIRVRVCATTVAAGDTRMRSFTVPKVHWLFARLYLGLFKPKRPILGMELSGTIDSVGKNVTRYKAGDEVYASTTQSGFGGYAEYKCFSENNLVAHKPKTVTCSEAAALAIGGTTALRFLQKGNIKPGQNVLIYGASGSVGTYAVQIAKHFGAKVTGVCSTANVELVKSLGAADVVDYTKEKVSQRGGAYDLIFDTVGKLKRKEIKQLLGSTGKFVSVLGNPGKITVGDLLTLNELVESGNLKPVIDREYRLEEIREAHRYVDSRRKKGNVVVHLS